MEEQIELLKATRALIIKSIDSLSLDEINLVPPNYNNNIAWNVIHLVVTQQLLHYGLSNNEFKISEKLIALYRKGTHPENAVSEVEWKEALELFKSLPALLLEDYSAGIFTNFKEYPTSYGYVLHNIEEAISFNNAHEALHLGYIMSMKKVL